jgi:hypothetical protein
MKGGTASAILVAVLALALAGQAVRWRDRMTASRLLSNVEALTQAVASGQVPPRALASNLAALRRAAPLDPLQVGIPRGISASAGRSGWPAGGRRPGAISGWPSGSIRC